MTVGEHERLRHAPVVEAAFELRIPGSDAYSLLPGKLAEALVKEYPVVREMEVTKLLGIIQIPQTAGLVVTHRYFSRDEKQLVQLSPHGIGVNTQAYPGFKEYRRAIASVLGRYLDLVGARTSTRIGLRYINRLPAVENDLMASFTTTFELPKVGDKSVRSIAARALYDFQDDPKGTLAVALSSDHEKDPMLDLDFFQESVGPLELEGLLTWLDLAHERVYQAFRALVPEGLFVAWK